jgi:GTP-binding protein
MIDGYLKNRSQIKLMLMLLDIRHEPGAHDRALYEWCVYYKLPLAVVCTKSDKLKRSQLSKNLAVIRRALELPEPPLPFSSETHDGRDRLWALIMDRCGLT